MTCRGNGLLNGNIEARREERRTGDWAMKNRLQNVKPWLIAATFIVAVIPFCPTVNADDWMFKRSYFSHALPPGVTPPFPVPESRSAYRKAYYSEGPTFQVRSAYRINNFVLQNGARSDRTIYQEGYIQFGP
jgi:hypothetical protein